MQKIFPQMIAGRFCFTVAAEHDGWPLHKLLERRFGLSRNLVRRLKAAGSDVRVDGQWARVVDPVRAGQQVSLWVPPAEAMVPLPLALDIAFEDDHVLVVNKPAGMLVHPSRSHHTDTLVSGVAHHLLRQGLPPHIHPVHRLDGDTSGLLLFAKHPFVLDRLAAALERRQLVRQYVAVVEGRVAAESGVIDAPIWTDPAGALKREVRPDGQPARTHYRVLRRWSGATLVELHLETGRTHQIRVHMAHLGHPLVGDWLYGHPPGAGPFAGAIGRHALHAGRLTFPHPITRETVDVQAPPPPDFAALLARLDRL
jgi:23S rRNA pseudouridine1911/1915/1917 synthase